MMKSGKGSCKVKFKIEDPEEKSCITMQPRNNAVDPAAFIRELDQIPELAYKLN